MSNYIKASAAKKFVKNEGLRMGKDALEQLDRKIHSVLTGAVQATKADRRSTMKAEDVK